MDLQVCVSRYEGENFFGMLEIDTPDFSGELTLGVSEYNQPAIVNRGPQSPSKTAVPVKYGDTYRLGIGTILEHAISRGDRQYDRAGDGTVEAISNSAKRVYGVQFHPEQMNNDAGNRCMKQFVAIYTN